MSLQLFDNFDKKFLKIIFKHLVLLRNLLILTIFIERRPTLLWSVWGGFFYLFRWLINIFWILFFIIFFKLFFPFKILWFQTWFEYLVFFFFSRFFAIIFGSRKNYFFWLFLNILIFIILSILNILFCWAFLFLSLNDVNNFTCKSFR